MTDTLFNDELMKENIYYKLILKKITYKIFILLFFSLINFYIKKMKDINALSTIFPQLREEIIKLK